MMAALFRLRLLTAQRGGEVHGAKWEEFDLASGWWTIPAERSKNRLSHRVPLSPQALRIFKAWHERRRVAVGLSEHRRSVRSHPPCAEGVRADRGASAFKFRGHDLRRTAASLMVGGGVPRLVVSKILNHVETGITAVYDRHGYDPEKRAALDFWGKRVVFQFSADVF